MPRYLSRGINVLWHIRLLFRNNNTVENVISVIVKLLFMGKEMSKPEIVVIGGGFAGLNFVKHINPDDYNVTIVDRHNYHSFPPLFYQVASAGLDPASICFPLRREIRKLKAPNIRFRMGAVERIDVAGHCVRTADEAIPYDILVVAAGTTNNFFNMPQLEKSVYTLKSTPQALRCRNDILGLLERASVETDSTRRSRLLNFVVVGGGPTGVEIAGAIGEMKRYILPREYPSIPQNEMTITIVEGSDRLLGSMSARSSEDAQKGLESLMVNVKLGAIMKSFENGEVTFADGSSIPASMVIWTAGVTAEHFEIDGAQSPFIGRGNRLLTDGYCQVTGLPDVYAIGDVSLMPDVDSNFPKGHPQLAQVAIQQGRLVARNLNAAAKKAPSGEKPELREFRYNDKGSMATIGRNRAVVDMKKAHMSGFIAWLAWMFVHLMSLLGMRNKITVLVNWIWAYFNYSTSLRLLIRPSRWPDRERWDR